MKANLYVICGVLALALAAGSPLSSVAKARPRAAKAQTTKKPATGTASKSTAAKSKTTASKKRVVKKKGPAAQSAPTKDRIQEIQTALAAEGSYQGQPTGQWDAATVQAMTKF